MSDFSKQEILMEIRNTVSFVNELNFSDDEILENLSKIVDVNKSNLLCKEQTNSCVHSDYLHEVFYRDKNNILQTTFVACEKAPLITQTKNNIYLVQHFNKEWANLLFNQNNIKTENEFIAQRRQIIKFLNKQIKTKKFQSMYLFGSIGVGKSYLCALFCNSLISSCSIAFVSIKKLFQQFKDNKNNNYKDSELFFNTIDTMKTVDILVWDDLGLEQFNNTFHIEYLLPILIHRLSHKLPVYFISNFKLDKLKLVYSRNTRLDSREYQKIAVAKFIEAIQMLVTTNIINLTGINWRVK